jgi:non-ribosomal peptide synthetase component F
MRGAIGRLFIGGAGVADAYHNDDVRTHANFVPNPFLSKYPDR